MFDLNFRQGDPYLQIVGGPRSGRHGTDAMQMVAGRERFDRARRRAQTCGLLARIFRQPRALLDLNLVQCPLSERHYAGQQTVAISAIVGSEGRCRDFDRDWLPLHPALAPRWISVFAAILQGVPMPPVTLIRVGDVYYVRDGHHRISVAWQRGCESIEADVTVWNASVEPPSAAEAPAAEAFLRPRWSEPHEPVAVP